MKVRHPMVLASCLGFVVGFAVCLCWRIKNEDEHLNAADSLSADVQSDPVAVVEPYESRSGNVPSQPEFPAIKITPRVFTADDDWKVTVWYQSLPPQKGVTFDPREYAAKRMGLTDK